MAVREISSAATEPKNQRYGAYYTREIPPPDPYLTETGPGTPMGEYMRRFWQPVCLSEELTDLPKAVKIMHEDLVAFRDKSGEVGVLQRYCSHRGTSLEYGVVSEKGIRCCYHGWLFDVDGTILETPGEPEGSKLKDNLFHGAYPAMEYHGIVHAYMGPPDLIPHFPRYDIFEIPGAKFAPLSIPYENNWLQTYENHQDPFHSVFLHQRIMQHFEEEFGVLPQVHFAVTDDGASMRNTSKRRLDDETVWVRIFHILPVNDTFLPSTFELPPAPLYYQRTFHFRRPVPIDDGNTLFIGWRIYGDDFPGGDWTRNGPGTTDMDGQVKRYDYEEIQRFPDDWNAQGSQWGGVTRHSIEHLGKTDIGIALTRRVLRSILDGGLPHAWPVPASEQPDGPPLTKIYSQDSLLELPRHRDPKVDSRLMHELGEDMTRAIIESADRFDDQAVRRDAVVTRFKELELEYREKFAGN